MTEEDRKELAEQMAQAWQDTADEIASNIDAAWLAALAVAERAIREDIARLVDEHELLSFADGEAEAEMRDAIAVTIRASAAPETAAPPAAAREGER